MGRVKQEALVKSYIASLLGIRGNLVARLVALFTGPKSWREDDAARFAARAVPEVAGAQRAAASLTEDYLTRIVADLAGEPYRPSGDVDFDKVTGAAVRNGVDPAVVYERPFQEVWSSLAEDRRRQESVEVAADDHRRATEAALKRAEADADDRRRADQRRVAELQRAAEEARGARAERARRLADEARAEADRRSRARDEAFAQARRNVDKARAERDDASRSAATLDAAMERLRAVQAAQPDRQARVHIDTPPRPDRPAPNEKPLTAAVERGQRRARLLGLTDVELAVTHTVREKLATDDRIRYFRRVLTGAENCGLCVVAATQRYHKKDLLPIHPQCDCVVAPILGAKDPGLIINAKEVGDGVSPIGQTRDGVPLFADDQLIDLGKLLEPVHRAVAAEFGFSARDARQIDYRKIMIVRDHGELGPVLAVKSHRFTRRQIEQRDLAAPAGTFSNKPSRG